MLTAGGEARARVGMLMAGDGCPEPVVADALANALRRRGQGPMVGVRLSAAVALVRARRAVDAARGLYTRANFAGCISLLSITEQELGRNLSQPEAAALQRAHRRLAEVNLWLGICQWAAGDPQTASASFVRSAQLPSSPVPDGRLLPPALLRHYSQAVSAPREEVSCTLGAGLTAGDLLVNGKGPTVKGRTLRVPAGTHYMVIKLACPAGRTVCPRRRRSMRLDGQPLGCRVPGVEAFALAPPQAAVCISDREGADPAFVAAVAHQAGAEGLLVTTLSPRRISLRYGLPGRADAFVRQVVSALPKASSSRERGMVATVERSIDLLLAQTSTNAGVGRPSGGATPWYSEWWVWGVAGATVAAIVVTSVAVAASSGNDRVNVVFDR